MKLCFKVTALSNLVIKASSNTEGKIRYLDFLPGSVFFGIAARNFDEFDNPFEVFFSSKVKFMDANPLNEDNITYKIPFSFYHEKLDNSKIYNFHFLTSDDFKADDGSLKQFKQIRSGYIDKNFNRKYVAFSYNQKSAIDYKKGRSKESQMFGYRSINKGEEFYFEVLIDEGVSKKDIKKLEECLVGERRVGKSKSAEYSKIKIEKIQEKDKIKSKKNNKIYIYFKSRAVLFDDEGNPTYDVKYAFDKKYRDKINYEKSNIRVYSYMPYNFVRRGYDSERFVIDKGSVVVLDIDNIEIGDFVGAFNNEGFGEILVNPEFLMEKEIKIKENNSKEEVEKTETKLSKFLNKRKNALEEEIKIINEVKEFIKNNKNIYKNISNSQWGNIRKIAKSFDEFKEKIEDFINKGVKKWEDEQVKRLLGAIDNSVNSKKFIILLASEMTKDNK